MLHMQHSFVFCFCFAHLIPLYLYIFAVYFSSPLHRSDPGITHQSHLARYGLLRSFRAKGLSTMAEPLKYGSMS